MLSDIFGTRIHVVLAIGVVIRVILSSCFPKMLFCPQEHSNSDI